MGEKEEEERERKREMREKENKKKTKENVMRMGRKEGRRKSKGTEPYKERRPSPN